MTMETINPATGEILKSYDEMSSKETAKIVSSAYEAYQAWQQTSLKDRVALLHSLAGELLSHKDKYGLLITKEMGKPLAQSVAEVEKCASMCTYYIENIEQLLKPKVIETEYKKSYVCYESTGVIFAIMPWNFPMWQVFRFAVPNITAGNVALLKHAPINTGVALAIEEIFIKAGYPKNIFRSLIIEVDIAAEVIANPQVAAVTITGSERAGASVASTAGKNLKKCVLELGGSDPYIVLADADLEHTATTIVNSRMMNAGQVCISPKRTIIIESVYDKLEKLILDKTKAFTLGDPLEDGTKMGPMARGDLRAELHQQIQDSVRAGAKLLLGGELPEGKGYYYPATILADVPESAPAYSQELFGPVISLIKAKDEDDAIRVANSTRFGLGGGVFTADLKKGEEIARNKIITGTCCVNDSVKSDPRLPFGGTKSSGFGREMSAEGLVEFLNIKTINIKE